MPAQLRILDTDGATVITSVNLGNIATPGTSSNQKLYIENIGDQTAETVTFSIEAVGTNDGDDYAQTATDVSGTPGTFGTTSISLGDIVALDRVAVWTRVTVPSGITSDNNPRQYNVKASGLTI